MSAERGHVAGDIGTLALGRSSRSDLARQRRLLALALVVSDAFVLAVAFALAYWVRFEMRVTVAPDVMASPEYYWSLTLALIPLWLLMFGLFNLYDPHAKLGGLLESSRAFHACTVATMLVIVGTFVVPEFVIARVWLTCVWLFSFLLVALNRFAARRVLYACRRRGYLLRPAIIVGTNEEARSLAAFLEDAQSCGVRTVGFVSTEARDSAVGGGTLPVLGTTATIRALIRKHEIEDVIVAITAVTRDELLALCEELDGLPVELCLSSGLYELLTTRVSVRTLGNVPLMTLQKNRLGRGEVLVKTALECSLAALALLLLSPLLLAIAIWIKRDSPGPVIYRRRVLGASRRPFDAFKFRTMHVNGSELLGERENAALRANHKLRDDPRVTQAGRWLRRYSLDELPQLANVLFGQMALVGPRMITPEESEKYGRHRMTLLAVKPGITGLWQVSGRSDLSYEERVRLDMYYVRNYSVWLDLQILFIETPQAVLKGRGAY